MTVLLNPYTFATSVGGGITDPDDIAGLVLWLDARTPGGSFSDGDALSGWDDQTVSSNNFGPGTSPNWYDTTYTTPGGQPLVRFVDSANDYLIGPDNLFDVQSGTTFMLVRPNSLHTGFGIAARTGTGGTDRWYLPIFYSTGQMDITAGATTLNPFTSGSPYSAATWYLLTMRADGNTKEVWVDGVSEGTFSDSNTGDGSTVHIGRSTTSSSSYLDGDVAVVLHYDNALSDSDVSDVHDWISDTFLTFDPIADISWDMAWWADDPNWTDPGDGNSVSQWDAAVGTVDLSQGVASEQPTFRSSAADFNGKAVIEFDGGDALDTGVFTTISTKTEIFMVVRWGGGSGTQFIFDGGTSGERWAFYRTVGGNFLMFAGSSGIVVAANDSNVHAWSLVFDPSGNEIAYDGTTEKVNSNAGSHNLSQLRLGEAYDGTSKTSSGTRFAFVGIIQGGLTGDERSALYSWAQSYYGIS